MTQGRALMLAGSLTGAVIVAVLATGVQLGAFGSGEYAPERGGAGLQVSAEGRGDAQAVPEAADLMLLPMPEEARLDDSSQASAASSADDPVFLRVDDDDDDDDDDDRAERHGDRERASRATGVRDREQRGSETSSLTARRSERERDHDD